MISDSSSSSAAGDSYLQVLELCPIVPHLPHRLLLLVPSTTRPGLLSTSCCHWAFSSPASIISCASATLSGPSFLTCVFLRFLRPESSWLASQRSSFCAVTNTVVCTLI